MTNHVESAQQFILNNISDIAWYKDLDSRYVAVNDAYAKMCGRPAAEIAGLTDDDLWPLELAAKVRDGDRQVIASGTRTIFEEYVVDPAGKRVWLETVKTPFRNQQGAIIGTIGIARDITARKETEAELRRVTREFQIIFDAIPATIWFKDTQNRFLKVNKATTEFLRCRPEDIEGKSAFDFFPRAEAEKYFRDDVEVIRSRKAKLGIIEEARTADGEVKAVRTDKIPYIDDDGNVLGVVAIAIDITDLKRAEKEREALLEREKAARDEAVSASRAKDHFLAMISHELRTPLTTVMSWAELIQMGQADPAKLKRGVEVIIQAAKTQAKLIEDLLDISRISSGKMQIVVGELRVTEPLSLAMEGVRAAADAKGIELQAEIPRDLDGRIFGDSARLQQVFDNILSNAIKFTPARGQVTVTVTEESDRLKIEFRDSGPGIKPEFLPYIFDAFSQADVFPARRQGGLGLGLSIARNLTLAHGGSVQAANAPDGKGAVFTVILPRALFSPIKNQLQVEVKKGDSLAAYRAILRGLRVLVLDDEESACDVFREILSGFDVDVKTASSASQAFETLQASDIDVVISDIAIPGEDGYGFVRRIRALPAPKSRVPAVCLTAFAGAEDATRALQAGFQAHLAKPVNVMTLVETLARVSGRLEKQSR
ncbi:MAG: PAS domain-containing protein [Oligoflexia bacterium]|nr:PAS domain-containing protein [Oligoflexia bacterium]